jgi:hypothetical protein
VMRPVFYDGCPGCAMERKLESSQGIPYKEFFFVGITTIASCMFFLINHELTMVVMS